MVLLFFFISSQQRGHGKNKDRYMQLQQQQNQRAGDPQQKQFFIGTASNMGLQMHGNTVNMPMNSVDVAQQKAFH